MRMTAPKAIVDPRDSLTAISQSMMRDRMKMEKDPRKKAQNNRFSVLLMRTGSSKTKISEVISNPDLFGGG